MSLAVRRRRNWLLAFFVLVALAIGASIAFNGAPPVRVRLTRPAVGRIDEIVTANSVGTVEPEKTAVISAEIAGKILRIPVRYGPVPAGQTVVELDARDLEAESQVTRREKDEVIVPLQFKDERPVSEGTRVVDAGDGKR
jgi:multidrug efflux pump subunit AcrA (membrane-fusion protein)